MEKLETLFMVGSQYYRAPTPTRSEWGEDLRRFAEHGLNTIKIWAQWRWNHPAEGEYYWDDLLELMDLAHQNGLHVVVNTIHDVAPAWVYRAYPDASMITHDGRRVGPQTLGHRQIGGAPGPCYHHPHAIPIWYEFLAQCARALKDAPALVAWDAWNEPELTCAIMREPTLSNLVCYCDHSRAAFIVWLRARYSDDLVALNRAWSTNYRRWDEVELPRSTGTFRDMLDWRRFFVDTITEELRQRVRILKENDPDTPVMAHTVPFPVFNLVSCASDDFALAEPCDLFGNSVGSSPFAADLLASAAPGKRVINAEVHALPGNTFYQFSPLDDDGVDRYLLGPLAQGIKGYLFWQYRPELLGIESPNWGLTDLQGRATPWLERLSLVTCKLQERSAFLLRAHGRPPDVGILLDPENEVFHWCITHGIDFLANAVRGAYDALHRANFKVTFLHPKTLASALPDLGAVYCPVPFLLQPETLDALRAYVEAGGRLIAEPHFAGIDAPTGMHRTTVPGAGWDAIFGGTQGYVLQPSAAVFDAYRAQDGLAEETGARLMARVAGREHTVPAYHQLIELIPTKAETLGVHSNGWAGLLHARYGEGETYLVGTLLSGAAGQGSAAAMDLLTALCETPRSATRPSVADRVARVDVLGDGQHQMLIVQALTEAAGRATLRLFEPQGTTLRDIMTEQEFTLRPNGRWAEVELPLAPGQVRALDVT